MRRLAGGMPGMLMATLWLVLRLVAPGMAMPGTASPADAVALAALQTICHASQDQTPDQGHAPDAGHPDCQLCPACHLAGQVALPTEAGGLIAPLRTPLGSLAWTPPATGPPARPRLAAQPTGPPTLPV